MFKIAVPFTEVKGHKSIEKYAIFNGFKIDSLKFHFYNSFLFYVDKSDKKMINSPNELGFSENFDYNHIFSKFISKQSYFFDGVNKFVFEGIRDEKPEGMKEYADIISA